MRRLLFISLLGLAACQTAQQKSEMLVADRAGRLKHLSSWKSTWCQVDTELTEPARARFEQMFPAESPGELSYAWRARESSCEVSPLVASSVAKSQQAFLETALCLLMQVHYVNSPFDELDIASTGIEPLGDMVHIKAGDKPDLGIFLPYESMTIETRTKSRGVLRATYQEQQGVVLPKRLEQNRGGTQFVVDEIEYEPTTSGTRPMMKSFWIEVGAEKPLRHSKAIVRDCRPL